MGFRLPTMPLFCDIYTGIAGPALPPGPVRLHIKCQLRFLRSANVEGAISQQGTNGMMLLVMPLTDIRMKGFGTFADVVECPSGTGRFYTVSGVDDVAKGFPNEYRAATMWSLNNRLGAWPFPYP